MIVRRGSCVFGLTLCLGAVLGCSGEESAGTTNGAGGSASSSTTSTVAAPSSASSTTGAGGGTPTTCLASTNCVTDGDCMSGYHCNTAIAPPQCTELYCGEGGSPCSEDPQCSSGLKCLANVCSPMSACLGGGESCSNGADCCNSNCDIWCCKKCKESLEMGLGGPGDPCNSYPVTQIRNCACDSEAGCFQACYGFCYPPGGASVPVDPACLECMQQSCPADLDHCNIN
jgi:hypothetical protein